MSIFDWNPEYSLGIELFDKHHKKLFEIIRALAGSIQGNKTSVSILLKELEDYTHYHFSAEEEFMEDVEYPGLKFHRAQHHHFIETIQQARSTHKDGQKNIEIDLMNFLCKWLIEHIRTIDRQYKPFYKNPRP